MQDGKYLTATQKGEVAENIVNNQIIALSGGRLSWAQIISCRTWSHSAKITKNFRPLGNNG